ncbi:MAG: hypothetical protein LC734_04485 [Acidobacteria bacterium]|nr:hypothetical protein [Acidobacteriota bacterium]
MSCGRWVVIFFALLAGSCVEKTIRTGAPPARPASTPPMRIEANIRLDDFLNLCSFLPDEGDQRSESTGEVKIMLADTKKRQVPSAVNAGCTPGGTFVFKGEESQRASGSSIREFG